MTDTTRHADPYQKQLARYARALATTRCEVVHDDLEGRQAQTGVKVFVSSNVFKRLERLRGRLEFLEGPLDDLEDLLAAYVREVPLAPYSTISGDADRCLRWLEGSRELAPEQRDCVACQHARFAVEAAGRANRLGHIRFQDLLSVASQLAPELGTDAELRIYLNPIRVWTRLVTRVMLDEGTSPPADVLFYAVQEDVRDAVLEPVGCALVHELSSLVPCSLDDWAERTEHAGRTELVVFCRDLAERGLVAFG